MALLQGLQEQSWFCGDCISKARFYGFHLTIGDAIDFNLSDIHRIEQEIEDILKCFNPAHEFTLTRRSDDYVTFWPSAVVLRYDANDIFKIFHTLIAARLHPLGTGSGYLQRYLENRKEKQPYRIQRTIKFLSPTVFDSYTPHFTLLDPFIGDKANHPAIAAFFNDRFKSVKDEITLKSICLLLQFKVGEDWIIHKEYPLPFGLAL